MALLQIPRRSMDTVNIFTECIDSAEKALYKEKRWGEALPKIRAGWQKTGEPESIRTDDFRTARWRNTAQHSLSFGTQKPLRPADGQPSPPGVCTARLVCF